MSDAVAEVKHFLFSVPEHIASAIFGGGCGAAHAGESDCERCAPLAAGHIYPLAPEAGAPVAVSQDSGTPESSADVALPPTEAPLPSPKAKRSAPADDAASSA